MKTEKNKDKKRKTKRKERKINRYIDT